MSDPRIELLAFEHAQLAEALDALASGSGLARARLPNNPLPIPPADDRSRVEIFFGRLGDHLGVAVEPVKVTAGDLDRSLPDIAPALIALPGSPRRWLCLLSWRRGHARVVTPSGDEVWIDAAALAATLIEPVARPAAHDAAATVAAAGLTGRRAEGTRRALVADFLKHVSVDEIYLLRMPPGRSFRDQLSRAGVFRGAAALLLLQLVVSMAWLLSWWMIGRIALGGAPEPGWMAGWGLCLICVVPALALVAWLQNWLGVTLGALLRRRLLAGALALDPDRTKEDGLGRLFGLVLEADALEALGATGGTQVLLAAVELLPVPWALAVGAGGWLHAGLFVLWILPITLIVRHQLRRRVGWSDDRLRLTETLVDNIVGHRTRLAQMPLERWHVAEDRELTTYERSSARYDTTRQLLLNVVARGWLVASIAALIPTVAAGAAPAALAVSIGGTLFAYAALGRLAGGMNQLVSAVDAWRRVRPLYDAPTDAPPTTPVAVADRPVAQRGAAVLEAHQVAFAHHGRPQQIFHALDLTLHAGDRVLLEGPSGGGKSTLASLLAAQRRPSSGLVLLDRLDLDTVGVDQWRRRVALVPQFHENHVVAETFLFNLMMARAWPPTDRDVADARQICKELGLDRLIESMPAGMMQLVGDSGWNLSHGERSRLYLARALLQDPDVLVVDESLAALDPQLVARVARAVLARARTLVVIAHP